MNVESQYSSWLIEYDNPVQIYCHSFFLCDILPHLNRLSFMFQSADLDLSLIQPQILATLEKLRQLWDTPEDYLKTY